MYDWLVVGAGFAGSILAERLASERDETVLLIDKRDHIGGNAYDFYNDDGILIHRYGPHIFHTNSEKIVTYLSKFTAWRPYEHRVLAEVDGQLVPIPINRTTLNKLYGLDLTEEQAAQFLKERAEPGDHPKNSRDVIVQQVGLDLYRKFFEGYTKKQWGLDPSELGPAVTSRIPVRSNDDDRYFTDTFQQMPRDGYTAMFQRIVDHPKIEVLVNTTFNEAQKQARYKRIIFTGPIDEYFGHRFGKLPYRSLRFEHVTAPMADFQQAAVVNYPQEHAYTRITEYKKLTGQAHPMTSVSYEYPTDEGEPYYPVPRQQNQELFARYDALARKVKNVWFVGRLANYRYFNMDQVAAQALKTFETINQTVPRSRKRAEPSGLAASPA